MFYFQKSTIYSKRLLHSQLGPSLNGEFFVEILMRPRVVRAVVTTRRRARLVQSDSSSCETDLNRAAGTFIQIFCCTILSDLCTGKMLKVLGKRVRQHILMNPDGSDVRRMSLTQERRIKLIEADVASDAEVNLFRQFFA